MINRPVAFGAACLVMATPAHAQEGRTIALQPATRWVLDFADERCSLIRSFGEGEQAIRLQISSYGSPASYRFDVVGKPLPESNRVVDDIDFRFTPDPAGRTTPALFGQAGEVEAISFSGTFEPYEKFEGARNMSLNRSLAKMAEPHGPDPAFERQVESLTISPGRREFVLHLGNMAEPLSAMRTCIDDLQATWGLDPAVEKSLTRRAAPQPAAVRKIQADYPTGMLRAGNSAFVPVRVMVDRTGEAKSCVIQSAAVDEDFKDATCDGLARKYDPALDRAGNPVESVFYTSVIYVVN